MPTDSAQDIWREVSSSWLTDCFMIGRIGFRNRQKSGRKGLENISVTTCLSRRGSNWERWIRCLCVLHPAAIAITDGSEQSEP